MYDVQHKKVTYRWTVVKISQKINQDLNDFDDFDDPLFDFDEPLLDFDEPLFEVPLYGDFLKDFFFGFNLLDFEDPPSFLPLCCFFSSWTLIFRVTACIKKPSQCFNSQFNGGWWLILQL